MALLVCGSEGEWALYENTLDALGLDDKRRGSVVVPVGKQMFKAFTGSDDIWVHARVTSHDAPTTVGLPVPQDYLEIRDSTGGNICTLKYSSNANTGIGLETQITYVDGGVTTVAEVFPAAEDEFNNWDIRIQITTVSNTDDTKTLSFYLNAQLRFSTTITDAGGHNQAAQIVLAPRRTVAEEDILVQDIIVSDAVPTVGMELAVLVPSAVGNYSAFTNDYTNIDDVGYDASNVISTATVTDRESWVFATPSFDLGDKVIYALVLDTVAQLDIGAVISDFQPFVRIASTNYAAASLSANSIAPDSYLSIWTENPATVAPWTKADLTGLEAGVLAQ
jgi:hypothetical protein